MTKLIPLLLVLVTSTAVAAPKPKNVAIVVYDHVEILDFAGPSELACTYALAGEKQKAIAAVRKAIIAGISKAQALADSDLTSIKADIQKM